MGVKLSQIWKRLKFYRPFISLVFTREDLENMPLPSQVEFDSPLNDIEFTSEDVYELLSKLKPTNLSGPDSLVF